MKNIWSGLLVAFSLYSAIPVPQYIKGGTTCI